MTEPLRRTRTEAEVARLTGGITYQDVFTFPERIRSFADELRGDIFRSSPSPSWAPRGFEVNLRDAATIRVGHVQHPTWRADITGRATTFEYDSPDIANLDETLRVQTELFGKVVGRLNVDLIRSIGIKVLSVIPMTEPLIDYFGRVLAVDPRSTIFAEEGHQGSSGPLEVAFRIAYGRDPGAVALQVSADSANEVLLVDFDAACTDPLDIPQDHLDFFLGSLTHFTAQVGAFLSPIGFQQLPPLLPGR